MADTLDEAFLDSLRALAADSAAQPVARVAPEVVRREVADLFGRPVGGAAAATFDIEVERYASHERVQYWMDYFAGRARRHFAMFLQRAGRYDSMIRTRLVEAGLPQDLIFLAMIESGFNHSIRSRAAAVGLWQFIAPTGRRYGLTIDAWVDDRRDPYRSTDAAIRMLSELNNRFGSLYLAAAAYNSGPGKIQRGLARYDFGALNGDDVYFALAEGTFLRRETRDYVPKIIAAALIAKDPERWGFGGVVPWEPLRYDSVQVSFAVGLDVLARLSGTSRDAMEDMNARFLRGVTPPDRTVWVRVPAGSRDSVAARLAVLPASARVTIMVHTVVRGETLSRIARQYGITIDDLKSANRLRSNRLARGQRLVIPTGLRTPLADGRTGGRAVRSTTVRRSTGTAATTRRVHVVRRGETLYGISLQFRVALDDLLRANNLTRRSTIQPGQTVRIP